MHDFDLRAVARKRCCKIIRTVIGQCIGGGVANAQDPDFGVWIGDVEHIMHGSGSFARFAPAQNNSFAKRFCDEIEWDHQNRTAAFLDHAFLQVVDQWTVFAVIPLWHHNQISAARGCNDAIGQKSAVTIHQAPLMWKILCLGVRIKDHFDFFCVGLLACRKVLKRRFRDVHGNVRINHQRFRDIQSDHMCIVTPGQDRS